MEGGIVPSGDRTRRHYQGEKLTPAHGHRGQLYSNTMPPTGHLFFHMARRDTNHHFSMGTQLPEQQPQHIPSDSRGLIGSPELLGLGNGLPSTDSTFPPELPDSDVEPQPRGQADTTQLQYGPYGQINPNNSGVSIERAVTFQGPNWQYRPLVGGGMEGYPITLQRPTEPPYGTPVPGQQGPWSPYDTRIESSQTKTSAFMHNGTNAIAPHNRYPMPLHGPTSDGSYPPSVVSTTSRSSNTPTIVWCNVIGCTASFTGDYRRGNFRRHLKVVHTKTEYLCEICGKSYNRTDARLKHYRIKHLHPSDN